MISAVEAVQAVKAIQRIPVELRGVTFFGASDEWLFLASHAPNMCVECEGYDLESYWGTEIRGLFQYLEIVDENEIYPKVHPSCGCVLQRVYPVEEVLNYE